MVEDEGRGIKSTDAKGTHKGRKAQREIISSECKYHIFTASNCLRVTNSKEIPELKTTTTDYTTYE